MKIIGDILQLFVRETKGDQIESERYSHFYFVMTMLSLLIASLFAVALAHPSIVLPNKLNIPQKLARSFEPPMEPRTFSWDSCGISYAPFFF